MSKISHIHLKEVKEALCYSERETMRINSLICFYANQDRIEMNRMIVQNNERYSSYEELFSKINAKFESQLENDSVVEPFTTEEIVILKKLFDDYVSLKEREVSDLTQLSSNNITVFALQTKLATVKSVFSDLIEIFNSYGK